MLLERQQGSEITNFCCKLSFFVAAFDVLKGLSDERKRYVLLLAVETDRFQKLKYPASPLPEVAAVGLDILGPSQCGQLEGLTALAKSSHCNNQVILTYSMEQSSS